MEVIETNKQTTLNDIRIEISLYDYFYLMFKANSRSEIVVNETRFNALSSQKGFNELVHVYSYEVEGIKLYRLTRMEDWIINSKHLEIKREIHSTKIEEAKTKHKIIEEWKKETLAKLYAKKIDKKQAEEYIIRWMNPERDTTTGRLTERGERDKKFAEKMNYPYRDENNVVE